jgi:hypothetical protein
MAWIAPMIPIIAKAATAAKVAKGAAIAAKLGTGISALSGAAQVGGQLQQNRKANAFSREMYEKTRADNIKFWDMQNEYNSPQKQMQRLQSAGLNPNMIYQSGGGTQAAGSIQTPDVQGGQFRAPDFSQISNPVQGYFDTKIKQAQYDNLLAANTTMQQEAILKAAQALGETSRTKGQGIANDLAATNFQYSVEAARLDNESKRANTSFTLAENERKAAMQAPTLQAAIENVLRIRAETANTKFQAGVIKQTIQNLKQDNRIRKFEERLSENNINKNDPLWARMVSEFISGITGGLGPRELGERLRNNTPSGSSPYGSSVKSWLGW